MASAIYFVAVLLHALTCLSFASKYFDEPCDRIRRPLHELSSEEQLIYAEGYQALRENGVLEIITATHHLKHHAGSHHGSNFMFWHSYLVWEVETAIRSLGNKYECFSMPYWDFAFDSGSEANASIFRMSIGDSGSGNENDHCVDDGTWAYYTVPELCLEDEIDPFCCLKRQVSQTVLLPTVSEVANAIVSKPSFMDFNDELIIYHGALHKFIGGNSNCAMASSYASDDPIFFVLHSSVEYLRLLWTSCHQYDSAYDPEIDSDIDADMYTPYCDIGGLASKSATGLMDSTDYDDSTTSGDGAELAKHAELSSNAELSPCGAIKWGDTMDYFPMNLREWSLSSRMDIQLKSMFNPKDWGVRYDVGSFYTNSHLNEWCANNLNNEWFTSSVKDNTEQSDQQKFVEKVWIALDENDGINQGDKFKIAESLSCKWNRENSPNSCWNEQMSDAETCSDRNIEDVSQLTLDDMLSFGGVETDSCLQKIRKELYDESFLMGEDVNMKLCNGEYDYRCPDYTELGYVLSVDNGVISVSMNQNGSQQSAYFAYYVISVILMAIFALAHIFRRCRNKEEMFAIVDKPANYSTF